jgi:hypothetical protein
MASNAAKIMVFHRRHPPTGSIDGISNGSGKIVLPGQTELGGLLTGNFVALPISIFLKCFWIVPILFQIIFLTIQKSCYPCRISKHIII